MADIVTLTSKETLAAQLYTISRDEMLDRALNELQASSEREDRLLDGMRKIAKDRDRWKRAFWQSTFIAALMTVAFWWAVLR